MLHLHAALEARFETPPAAAGRRERSVPCRTIRDAQGRQMAQTAFSTQSTGTIEAIVRERVRGGVESDGYDYALYTLTGDSQYEKSGMK
ncbi:hypothetical protein KCP77_00855 [Salmonella enterica subsp. enterica]|nr:hypothetical protein KCP77_00855 [Salmonella enterica subsp. enterica]